MQRNLFRSAIEANVSAGFAWLRRQLQRSSGKTSGSRADIDVVEERAVASARPLGLDYQLFSQ